MTDDTTAPVADDALAATVLYQQAPCGLLVTTGDGRILRANATFATWTGLSTEQLTGTALSELLEPGAQLFYETRFLPVLRLDGELREIALSLRTADGGLLPVLVNADLDREHGDEPLIHVAAFAASERQEYERQLLSARRSAEDSETRTRILQDATAAFGDSATVEQLAHALAESAQDAVHATAAAVFLAGHDPHLVGGTVPIDAAVLPGGLPHNGVSADTLRSWSIRDHDDSTVAAALQSAGLDSIVSVPLEREGEAIGTLACYFAREPDLDDHVLDLLAALSRQAAQGIVRLQLQAQLAAIALYDPLTGLANRFLLRTHITAAVAKAVERTRPLALLFVDLDDFKAVNDELDHAAGDTVLKLVAARLTAAVRSEDLVCRYGGDEFIIVCEDTDQAQAASIAERIRVAIKQPLYADGWQRTITASVGVTVHTTAPSHLLNGPELLRIADKAMYRSKDRGKDRVTVTVY